MKTLYIIALFGAAFYALYEQSKAEPNTIAMIIAIVVFMIGLMKLMSKVPSRSQDNDEENDV